MRLWRTINVRRSKGCGRRYEPKRWNKRYCQDPECLRLLHRDWGTTFDVNNTLATVLIDRLMHHGEALVIKGDSYRMKDKNPDSPSE